HARRAWGLLCGRGYAPQFPLARGWQEVYRRRYPELAFFRHDPRTVVDLHWGLLPAGFSFTPAAADVWDRLDTAGLGPSEVPTLRPERTLLFFCLHGAKHDWESLGWVCDLAELIRARPGMNWDEVLAWAAVPGRERLVHLGLYLAVHLLDAPVPR